MTVNYKVLFYPSDRSLYLSRIIALGGVWALTYSGFALIKILYPSQSGVHEFLSYAIPIILLAVLGGVLLSRLQVLAWKRLGTVLFCIGVVFYLINKFRVVFLLVPYLPLLALDIILLLSSFLPLTLLSLVMWGAVFKNKSETHERLSPALLAFGFISFLLAQAIGLSDSTRYRTHANMMASKESLSLRDTMRVANNLASGVGVSPDAKAAISLYADAYNRGAPDAALYLALLYDREKNEKATEWYNLAVRSGSDWAKHILDEKAGTQARSDDANQDQSLEVCKVKESSFDAKACRDVARQGNVEAQYLLARHLHRVYRDKAQLPLTNVTFWYEQAAIGGHSGAIWQLASLYEEGGYYFYDFKKAAFWSSISVKHGYVWQYPHSKILSAINKFRENKVEPL